MGVAQGRYRLRVGVRNCCPLQSPLNSTVGLLARAPLLLLLAGFLWADASVLCFHGTFLGDLKYLSVCCFVMGGGVPVPPPLLREVPYAESLGRCFPNKARAS